MTPQDRPQSRFEETIAKLKRERDELALEIELGKAEAREEWKALEAKLAALEAKSKPAAKAVGETAQGVGASLELAADEIKRGFEKLRKLL
jgi:BMFP domain-containing protein YqiC